MMIDFSPATLEFPLPRLDDPCRELAGKLAALPGLPALAGRRVAVAVGSRKIAGIDALARAVVAALAEIGAEPFVVPAMGSHGVGRAIGQQEVLASLGITEGQIGAPIVSTDDLVRAGATPSGMPVWVDRAAWRADAIVPVNRVKPHTAFRGRVESGPSKMLAVALGKSRSAGVLHRVGLADGIPAAAGFLISSGKVPFGVGIVENARGETAALSLLTPGNWFDDEAALLREAWRLYPRLPWDQLDLLVVERIGKEVSGTGMDINVIGMNRRFPGSRDAPRIGRVVALDLTRGSDGNATGIGYADVVTRRLAGRVDWEKTRHNCAVSGFPEAARLPEVAEDEDAAIRSALASLSGPAADPATCRAVRIRDTSSLAEIGISPALRDDFRTTSIRDDRR